MDYLDIFRDTFKVFILIGLSLVTGLEASMVDSIWNTSPYANTLTLYSNTEEFIQKQFITLIVRFKADFKIM